MGRFIEENIIFDLNVYVMSGEGWVVCIWVLRCFWVLKKYVLNYMNDLLSVCESFWFDDFVVLFYDKLFDEDWRKFGGEIKYDVKNVWKVVGEDGVIYRIWD